MSIMVGTCVGPYEVQALLGAGGMGEVYRARDTRLDRIVAIKVLSADRDKDLRARRRFEQEARAVSLLNHPNICTLFDIGEEDDTPFLVMEYLEGETLASRLIGGPLPVDQVLRYAIEIVNALDHAHRRGIVHRDLKPSNVMLTADGAKLVDFGLARSRPTMVADTQTAGERQTQTLTIEGTILGTLSYMAPEQLHGAETDARTDIFAFGAVMYEMLTGRRAFEGPSQASVMAAILERTPEPPSTIQPIAAPLLESIVMRCLAKVPDERWQTANDLRQALKWIVDGSSGTARTPLTRKSLQGARRVRWIWGAAALIGLVASFAATARYTTIFNRRTQDLRSIRFLISPPEHASFTQSSAFMSVSPDGHTIAFVASSDAGKIALWIRSLDSLTAREVVTDGVQPFWSPDSRFLGFHVRGRLGKIDVAGGVPQTLSNSPSDNEAGAWSQDGVILFKADRAGALYRIAAAGGTAAPATVLDESVGETSHDFPSFLPDGRHFLYLAKSGQPERDEVLCVASLDSTDHNCLFKSDSNVVYVEPGFLIFMLGNTLLAQAFDANTLHVTGDPIPIADQVERNPDSHRGAFSASQNGVLAYRPVGDTELVWFDRTGQRLQRVGPTGRYSNPALSPDNKQVAVAEVNPGKGKTDIWTLELARGVASRLTVDSSSDDMPLWSPDGQRIVFKSNRAGSFDFYQKPLSGSASEALLLKSPAFDPSTTPLSLSPDGRFLLYSVTQTEPLRRELWLQPLFGDRKPFPYLQTPFRAIQGQISPDGRWLAYASNDSGRNEVYLRPFPSGDGKTEVSVDGGLEPAWRADGRELFYLAGNQDLMAVPIGAGSAAHAGSPIRLFGTTMSSGTVSTNVTRNQYVVSADGQRFLINQPAAGGLSAPITLVVNWAVSLRK